MSKLRGALVLVALFSTMVWAQGQRPGPAPGPAPSPAPSPNPNAPQPTQPNPTNPTRPGQPTNPNQPTFPNDENPMSNRNGVTGRIIPSPGTRVRVDLYESGIRLDTAFTNTDGTFSFPRQSSNRRYEIHIDVGPGLEYVEEVDFGFGFPVMIHIREQGIKRVDFAPGAERPSGTTISVASLNVPKDAAKEFDKGRQLGQKKKYDEALVRLRKATEIYPRYAEAFNEIGLVYRRQNQNTEAEAAFQQAIHADPDWVGAYLNLASMELASNQPAKLLETSGKVLKLNPTLGPAYFFHSVANYSLGKMDEAEKDALQADHNDHAQVPQVHLLLARIYQNKGQQTEYVKQLREYLKEDPNASNAEKIKAELAQLKDK